VSNGLRCTTPILEYATTVDSSNDYLGVVLSIHRRILLWCSFERSEWEMSILVQSIYHYSEYSPRLNSWKLCSETFHGQSFKCVLLVPVLTWWSNMWSSPIVALSWKTKHWISRTMKSCLVLELYHQSYWMAWLCVGVSVAVPRAVPSARARVLAHRNLFGQATFPGTAYIKPMDRFFPTAQVRGLPSR
jgi:hypothetical protein